jgi:hypothetical protein
LRQPILYLIEYEQKLEISDASELVREASQWVQSGSYFEACSLIGVES